MKKLQQRTILVLAVVLTMLFALSAFALASSASDLQNKKNDLNSQIQSDKDDLAAKQDAQGDAQAKLDDINAKLKTIQAKIDQNTADLKTAEDNLAQEQQQYADIKAQLSADQAQLRARVTAIYKNGDISYLDVLFSADTVQDFISDCIFLSKIVDQDQSTVTAINENKTKAEATLAALEKTKNQIAALTAQNQAEEAKYADAATTQNQLVDQLGTEAADLQAEISDEQSQMADITAQIQAYEAAQAKAAAAASASSSSSSSSASASAGTGSVPGSTTTVGSVTFSWPLSIKGTITSKFGARSNPMGSGSENHPGIDIAAPKGTPVLAAADGTVIISKMNSTGGYGNYIVISHGGSLSTLYGHMSALYANVGDTVSRGQQIGAVGSTGRSTGNHLHFGVLVNGSPVNPLNYVSQP